MKIKAALMAVILLAVSLSVFSPVPNTVQASNTSNLVVGINYLSAGNAWADTDVQLARDFSLFASNGITHISMRLMWSTTEPTFNPNVAKLSATAMNNYRRVLVAAYKVGIKVNVDFWTQNGYTLGLPNWVGSYYDIVTSEEYRGYYIRYMQAVVNELKGYPAIESWSVLNEPYYPMTDLSIKSGFEEAFPLFYHAIKYIDPTRIVTCRFTLSYTPASGHYSLSVYDVFDQFAVTEYLDPSKPTAYMFNANWGIWRTLISDLTKRGQTLWVIEFGNKDPSDEYQRTYYEGSLAIFANTSIVARAYSWGWQTRQVENIGGYNIYDGTNPRPAYHELAIYAGQDILYPLEPPVEPPVQPPIEPPVIEPRVFPTASLQELSIYQILSNSAFESWETSSKSNVSDWVFMYSISNLLPPSVRIPTRGFTWDVVLKDGTLKISMIVFANSTLRADFYTGGT